MFVYLSFELKKKTDVFYLPFAALTGDDSLWYVTEDEQEELTAHELQFTPGYSNEDFFEVPRSYRRYRFIVEGQHFLAEGQKVKILEDS
jgi:hypothetical protein